MASASCPIVTGGVRETLSAVRISQVYFALTGREPRRTGPHRFRGPAAWRNGDGFNVSMDDACGVWHDFVTGEGGGVLDLVVRVRGGPRHEALRWVAEFIGRPLDDRPLTAFEHACRTRRQRKMQVELPKARLWRRAALALGEQALDQLKAALVDRTLPRPEPGQIAYWTTQLTTWHQLEGAALVAEYMWWAQHEPGLTAGMIYAAKLRETAERRALNAYLSMTRLEGGI